MEDLSFLYMHCMLVKRGGASTTMPSHFAFFLKFPCSPWINGLVHCLVLSSFDAEQLSSVYITTNSNLRSVGSQPVSPTKPFFLCKTWIQCFPSMQSPASKKSRVILHLLILLLFPASLLLFWIKSFSSRLFFPCGCYYSPSYLESLVIYWTLGVNYKDSM